MIRETSNLISVWQVALIGTLIPRSHIHMQTAQYHLAWHLPILNKIYPLFHSNPFLQPPLSLLIHYK